MQENGLTVAPGGRLSLDDGLQVHRLGFGAMRITGDGVWGPPRDRSEAERVLRAAVDMGIDFIDTADSYGPHVSEEILAATLHPYPAGLVIATKGGLVRPGPNEWERDGRPEHLRRACEGSLRRLRLEQLPLYQLHAVDAKVPFVESVGALADLQREGKIRYVGLSNVSVKQLHQARAIVHVVTVQNRYNLTDRSSEEVLKYCEREGIGFIPWYPLGTGELAKSGGVLGRVAARHAATPGQVALAWLLRHSPVMMPIPGTSKVSHLEENVRAASLELTAADMAELDRAR